MELTEKKQEQMQQAKYLAQVAIAEIDGLSEQAHVRQDQLHSCLASLTEAQTLMIRVHAA